MTGTTLSDEDYYKHYCWGCGVSVHRCISHYRESIGPCCDECSHEMCEDERLSHEALAEKYGWADKLLPRLK